MFVDHRVVSAYQENSYLLGCKETSEAVLIDPGDEPEVIWEMVESSGMTIKYIINTHGHIDHIGAVAEMKRRTNTKFYMHPKDQYWIDILSQSASVLGVPSPEKPVVDYPLEEGQSISVGKLTLEVIYTPGHSEGHVSFFVKEHDSIFSGDCLFKRGIGRTDLPGGDYQTLMNTLLNKLCSFPDQTVVYPGHGESTTIGEEKESNPFLQA